MRPNLQEAAGLVTFTEEILNFWHFSGILQNYFPDELNVSRASYLTPSSLSKKNKI